MAVQANINLPEDFRFAAVSSTLDLDNVLKNTAPAAPTLGPLAAFAGSWTGNGFNSIFRPNNVAKSPTPLPAPLDPANQPFDNVLELNLTEESLSFSGALGSVPNRGMVQGDAFLNGVPYVQTISDITTVGQKIGIHVEPGLWMSVPATSDPSEGSSVARMASIPHGTTVVAQGGSRVIAGKPTIPSIDMTPFAGANKIAFLSQTATNKTTPRIPQDLTSFIAAGTITPAMLADPNTVIRNVMNSQNVVSTTEIHISTNPAAKSLFAGENSLAPFFAGGTDNIMFLQGNPQPNAQTTLMEAFFWIETIEVEIVLPIIEPGHAAPITLHPTVAKMPFSPTPTFTGVPVKPNPAIRIVKVRHTQIQYAQVVVLNFNGLSWPHVSVATLVPATSIPLPPSVW